MTHYRRLLMVLVAAALSFEVTAAPTTGCAAKQEVLEHKIDIAESHGNHRQAAGLRRALAEVERNCSDGQLLREREKNVERAREKVREREAELAREQREGGSARKIQKRQTKLEKARAKLAEAEAELAR